MKSVNLKLNRQIILLVGAILAVALIFFIAIKIINSNNSSDNNHKKADIASIIKNRETKVVYIGSNDSKKCTKCSEVVSYLDKNNIEYVSYIVDEYSEREYNAMLKSLNINPTDFGYPAVLYIKNGALYANVINISKLKSLKIFVRDYELKTEKIEKTSKKK